MLFFTSNLSVTKCTAKEIPTSEKRSVEYFINLKGKPQDKILETRALQRRTPEGNATIPFLVPSFKFIFSCRFRYIHSHQFIQHARVEKVATSLVESQPHCVSFLTNFTIRPLHHDTAALL